MKFGWEITLADLAGEVSDETKVLITWAYESLDPIQQRIMRELIQLAYSKGKQDAIHFVFEKQREGKEFVSLEHAKDLWKEKC